MKTIDQIKDCQAIELGYNSFRDLVINPKKDMSMYHLNLCIERSIKEFADQVATEALRRASANAITPYCICNLSSLILNTDISDLIK